MTSHFLCYHSKFVSTCRTDARIFQTDLWNQLNVSHTVTVKEVLIYKVMLVLGPFRIQDSVKPDNEVVFTSFKLQIIDNVSK